MSDQDPQPPTYAPDPSIADLKLQVAELQYELAKLAKVAAIDAILNKVLLTKAPERGKDVIAQAFNRYEKRIEDLRNENAGLRQKLAERGEHDDAGRKGEG